MVDEKSTKQDILSAYQKLVRQAKPRRAELPPELFGFSTRNTKGDLLEALRKLDAALAANASPAPAEQIQTPAPAETPVSEIPVVKEKQNIGKQDATVSAPGKTTREDEMSLLNQNILDQLEALDQAKALKKKEYETCLAVERELEQFVNRLNRYRDDLLAQAQRHAESLAKQAEVNAARLEAHKCDQDRQVKTAESNLALARSEMDEKVRQRDNARTAEREKYAYELSVKQQREDDAWADESAKREAALQALTEETAALEKSLSEQEPLLLALNQALADLPAELAKEREAGAKQREKELKEDYAHQSALAQMEAEAVIRSLERQIQSIKDDYTALMAEKEAVQVKLDKAYEDSNKLYLQTVQSAGGIKIISNAEKT